MADVSLKTVGKQLETYLADDKIIDRILQRKNKR
jgi:hypothetical protein